LGGLNKVKFVHTIDKKTMQAPPPLETREPNDRHIKASILQTTSSVWNPTDRQKSR
jgi:hypothetical protein